MQAKDLDMRRVFAHFSKMRECRRVCSTAGRSPHPPGSSHPKPGRTTRRLRHAVARVSPLRTEAVLSRIHLAAGLAARTSNCGGRRCDNDEPSLASLLRTEAVLSRILLAAGAVRRGVRSFACIPETWRTTRRLRRAVARAPPSCALRQSSAASS